MNISGAAYLHTEKMAAVHFKLQHVCALIQSDRCHFLSMKVLCTADTCAPDVVRGTFN